MNAAQDRSSRIREIIRLILNEPQENQLWDAIKLEILPSKLFRYRNVNQYSLEEIASGNLFLRAPKDFNDPFDSGFNIKQAEIEKTTLIRRFSQAGLLSEEQLNHIRNAGNPFEAFLEVSKTVLSPQAYEVIIRMNEVSVPVINRVFSELKNMFQEKMRICCFSEDSKSILMWSHYANKHSGFCLEYDTDTWRPSDASGSNIVSSLFPVSYEREFFDATEIALQGKGHGLIGYAAASCKAVEWSYEKEWRYISVSRSGETRNFGNPSAIILGDRISQSDATVLRKIAVERGISVKQASVVSGRFDLEIKSVT